MISQQKFYDRIRPFFGERILPKQFNGMQAIITEWDNSGLTDIRWLAYMLATTFHETAFTMQPIEEYGKGRGRVYGKADPITGKVYYGRGFVQLTWASNYKKMGKILGIDLYNHPELALELETATKILFEGMTTGESYDGDFTGKHLGDYFSDTKNDPFNARRIINGTDAAKKIEGYYCKFLSALS